MADQTSLAQFPQKHTYFVSFMVILRVVLIDLCAFVKVKSPFNLFHTKIDPPFFTFNKHINRFIQVKFASSKISKLKGMISLINNLFVFKRKYTSVESSVRSAYPAFCTSLINLSSFDCCSIVKFPRCLPN